jgi:hypothetical protein
MAVDAAKRAESVVDKSVLVAVAHLDDAEAFCGGTIARLTRAGNHVTLARGIELVNFDWLKDHLIGGGPACRSWASAS